MPFIHFLVSSECVIRLTVAATECGLFGAEVILVFSRETSPLFAERFRTSRGKQTRALPFELHQDSASVNAKMSSGAFVDRIDPFAKRSLKKKSKKSQGSSRYRNSQDVELQQLPLLKG